MKIYIIASIVVLMALSIVFFGCVTTEITYGYALKNPKSLENLREHIVEYDNGMNSTDRMTITINPQTEIERGYIESINEYKMTYKEPYSNSIGIQLMPYPNCTINELWLKIGKDKINLKDKISEIYYWGPGIPYIAKTYIYTQEDLKQFSIDGILYREKAEKSEGITFRVYIGTDVIPVVYNKIRSFEVEIYMTREDSYGRQYQYNLNVPFKRKKMVNREPVFFMWLFSKIFFNDL